MEKPSWDGKTNNMKKDIRYLKYKTDPRSKEELLIEVYIIGGRTVFGRQEFEIRPVKGKGQLFVNKDSLYEKPN